MNSDNESGAFVIFKDVAIAGFLGVDADLNKRNAELWGPFILDSELMGHLWEKALHYFEGQPHTYFLFADTSNHLYDQVCFKKWIPSAIGSNIHGTEKNSGFGFKNVSLLPVHLHSDFIHLHDTLFPRAYYSGKEIIERINDDHKVYTSEDENGLDGYLYAEYNRQEKEGSIEFIGVDPDKRMKGIGRNLLEMAVHDLFVNSVANSIKLCVETANEKALSIYKKAGFKVERSLNFFKLDIRVKEQ